MAALRTELVKRRHAYTGEDVPWEIAPSGRAGFSLSRCLRGRGLRGTSARVAVERRQGRFLRLAAAIAALWLVLFFV